MKTKKRILVLNFYRLVNPPTTGGLMRLWYIYHYLSQWHKITFLSSSDAMSFDGEFSLVKHNDNFTEYIIFKEKDYYCVESNNIFHDRITEEYSGLTTSRCSGYKTNFHKVFLDLYKKNDIIIQEHPFMTFYDLLLGLDNKPRIYASHNSEINLSEKVYKGNKKNKYTNYIFELEKKLCNSSKAIFSVSNEDKLNFINNYKVDNEKVYVIPNGIEISIVKKIFKKRLDHNKSNDKLIIFFIGGYHPPNIEAAKYICDKLAPKIPGAIFKIAGSCTRDLKHKPKNVEFLGFISDEQKEKLYLEADVAVNPMFSGGGTNIKLIEYLASGIPTVCSEFGSRGIEITNTPGFYIVKNTSEFIKNIHLASKLKTSDCKLIHEKVSEKYNWETGAKKISQILCGL